MAVFRAAVSFSVLGGLFLFFSGSLGLCLKGGCLFKQKLFGAQKLLLKWLAFFADLAVNQQVDNPWAILGGFIFMFTV